MNKNLKIDLITTLLLICLGLVLRLTLQDYPNVSPVAALALFAGYLLHSRTLAIVVPLSVLVVSDLYFGGYAPVVMATVYVFLALPVVAGRPLRSLHQRHQSHSLKTASVGGTGLLFAILFFLGSNLAVWGASSYYTRDWTGLVECYTAALPFFRQTLIGDLAFVSVFFGSYAMFRVWINVQSRQAVTQ